MPQSKSEASGSKSTSSSDTKLGTGVPPAPPGGIPSQPGSSSSLASTSESSPFDPFSAAANEDARRLQGSVETIVVLCRVNGVAGV